MLNKRLLGKIGIGLVCMFQSCVSNSMQDDMIVEPSCNEPEMVSYEMDVEPVLLDYTCIGCHNENFQSGGVALSPFDALQDEALNGKLLCSIEWTNNCDPMPKNGAKMDECEINIIRSWIAAGAPNN